MTIDKKPVTAAPPDVDPAQAPQGRPPGTSARADAATIETHREGRVIAWSAIAQAVFGCTAQEMLGMSADCMFTPQDLANHRAAIMSDDRSEQDVELSCCRSRTRARRWPAAAAGAGAQCTLQWRRSREEDGAPRWRITRQCAPPPPAAAPPTVGFANQITATSAKNSNADM